MAERGHDSKDGFGDPRKRVREQARYRELKIYRDARWYHVMLLRFEGAEWTEIAYRLGITKQSAVRIFYTRTAPGKVNRNHPYWRAWARWQCWLPIGEGYDG